MTASMMSLGVVRIVSAAIVISGLTSCEKAKDSASTTSAPQPVAVVPPAVPVPPAAAPTSAPVEPVQTAPSPEPAFPVPSTAAIKIVPPPISDSQSWLALKLAQEDFHKHWAENGDSIAARESGRVGGYRLWQRKGVTCKVIVEEISDADRLNGVEFSREVRYRTGPFRRLEQYAGPLVPQ